MKTPRFIQAATPVLNGAGQVMFQQSAWTGILFLIGIFWGAYECHTPAVAWGAVVGLIASYIAGVLLEPDGKGGAAGLWGFNGILVGCAFPTFLSDTPLMWAALIFCAMLSTWVRTGLNNLMAPFKINSLTFPFVLLTWIFLLSSRILDGIAPASLSTPELTGHFSTELSTSFGDLVVYWLKGISQVFLINSWVTGILFLVGLALCSLWAAAWAAIGSAISLALAILFKADGADIASGLFGFSPVLTGIAIGCTFYQPNVKSAVWAVVAIIATFFIQAAMDVFMMPFGLPTLTGPFCITTWLFLLPLYKFKKNVDTHTEWDSAWDGFVANLRDDETDKK